ncbi:MAG: hypothetical protein LBT38_08775 [Deltaproteobacteria bacterium]|jgi:hypothetical protein|nr:hypothetical protein [Deltaproteobacteria bacterium]
MSTRINETLDSPILEPLSSAILATVSDAELLERLRGLGFRPVSPQTVDQKTTAKVEEKPATNTAKAENNKDLCSKIDNICDRIDTLMFQLDICMLFISLLAVIYILFIVADLLV